MKVFFFSSSRKGQHFTLLWFILTHGASECFPVLDGVSVSYICSSLIGDGLGFCVDHRYVLGGCFHRVQRLEDRRTEEVQVSACRAQPVLKILLSCLL